MKSPRDRRRLARLLQVLSRVFLALIVAVFMFASVMAQQGGTITYVYDDNGRLHAVISPSGEAVVYEYDAAGNITSIRRLTSNTLAIFSFSPHEGLPGDQVTIVGIGFGSGVSDVSFNGASATIVNVTASRIVVTVPAAATTGLITVTTSHGSVSTATAFTIVGVRISPTTARVHFGETVQFTAQVFPATLDQSVIWSVDGNIGGNVTVGTISTTGIYTAPNNVFASLTIRATSSADSGRFGEAQVAVRDPNDVQTVFAASLTVQRGDTIPVAPSAAPLTVQRGDTLPVGTQAPSLAVQYNKVTESQTALSRSVTVQRNDTVTVTSLSQPVSVQYDNLGQYTAQTAVSATSGPFIQSISLSSLTRGTTTSITINGVGLTGATTLRFINSSGTNDTTITVSNIVVSGDGNSLTATLTIAAGAAFGNRIVVIPTPNGDSVRVDVGTNTINVVP